MTHPGRSSGCWDFSTEDDLKKEASFTKIWIQQEGIFFLKNLGHSRLPSSLQKISQWDTTLVIESFTPTHPGTRILSLMTHQDVKYVSFLQRKYGRYKDPMVAFVVVFGSFPSCSTVCRDPGGDQCTAGDYILKKLLSGSGSKAYIILDRFTAIHLCKWLDMSVITHTQGDRVTCGEDFLLQTNTMCWYWQNTAVYDLTEAIHHALFHVVTMIVRSHDWLCKDGQIACSLDMARQ